MAHSWSDQIAERYHLQLPPDVRAWWDEGVWSDEIGGAEFTAARSPNQMLHPQPGDLWGGFMLPDTLPMIGNGYGDWLCLRPGVQGEIGEIIYWCHRGGDWISYGDTLSEAFVYDAAQRIEHDRRVEWGADEPIGHDTFQAAEWALQRIDDSRRPSPFWRDPNTSPEAALRETGESSVAAQRDLALAALYSPLKQAGAQQIAKRLGVPWEPDWVQWSFDGEQAPQQRRAELAAQLNCPADALVDQDWEQAERIALRVIDRRDDMGWAYDIAGWAAERRGDRAAAVRWYERGLRCSFFTDDCIHFRSHWFDPNFGKFAAARLYELRDDLEHDLRRDPYLQLFWERDEATLPERVASFWMREGDQQLNDQLFLDAYRSYYAAGWDLGLRVVHQYDELLGKLAAAADAAGAAALRELADLHRQFVMGR